MSWLNGGIRQNTKFDTRIQLTVYTHRYEAIAPCLHSLHEDFEAAGPWASF